MNDALEQRAVVHLLNLLGRERSLKSRRRRVGLTEADPDAERSRRLAGYRSAVEALRAIGAVSAAEAAAWKDRFEAAATEAAAERPEPDAETRRRVTGFLGELFAGGQRGEERGAEEKVISFTRSVWALEGVGAIQMDEAQHWVDRMHAEHGLPTPEEEDERERARTCSALDLRRVVPAPMAVGGLRISHLELYADGALLYSLELGEGARVRPVARPTPRRGRVSRHSAVAAAGSARRSRSWPSVAAAAG